MLKNILLTGVALFLVGVSRLGFNAVALNVYGEEVAGRLNIALSLGVLLSIPASTAFGASVVRFVGQARGQGRQGRVAWIFRRLFLGTCIIALAASLAAILFREEIAGSRQIAVGLVVQAAVLAFLYAVYLFLKNALYAIDRVAAYAKLELLAGAAFFSTLGSLAVAGLGDYLLLAFLAGYTIFAVTCLASQSGYLLRSAVSTADYDRVNLHELASYSMLAMAGTAVSLGVREVAVLAAPSVGGLDGPAYLALSFSLLAPMGVLPRLLRSVLLARSAELDGRNRLDELKRSVSEVSHWLLLATLPLCCVVVLGAGPLLRLVGGDATSERILMLRLLTVGMGLDVLATPAINALSGVGRVKVPALSALLGFVLAVVIWLTVAPGMGLNGLVLGLLANSAVRSGIPLWIGWRQMGVGLTRSPATGALLAGVAIALAVVGHYWPHPAWLSGIYIATATVVLVPSIREVVTAVSERLARASLGRQGP